MVFEGILKSQKLKIDVSRETEIGASIGVSRTRLFLFLLLHLFEMLTKPPPKDGKN